MTYKTEKQSIFKSQWNRKLVFWKKLQNQKPLARLTKKKREDIITKIKSERVGITTNAVEMKIINGIIIRITLYQQNN